jgi:hypothetical protein
LIQECEGQFELNKERLYFHCYSHKKDFMIETSRERVEFTRNELLFPIDEKECVIAMEHHDNSICHIGSVSQKLCLTVVIGRELSNRPGSAGSKNDPDQ